MPDTIVLLFSFITSFLIYLGISKAKQVHFLAQKLAKSNPSTRTSECILEAVNIQLHELKWVPTFYRVYIIGIVETVYIALCRLQNKFSPNDQSSSEKTIDSLISKYVQDHQSRSEMPLAVITGGDSGIGLEICRGLLKAGFHIIIGTRSLELCQKVIEQLSRSTGSNKASFIEVDLTSFDSVKNFVRQVKMKAPKQNIELLINNAGIMNVPCDITENGFESQCQTNFLSPALISRSLLPYMNEKSGRILFASSSTLYTINNLDTQMPLTSYGLNGLEHYAFSKACIAHFTARFTKATRVKVFAYHPGTVRTKLFAHTTVFNIPFISKLFDCIMLSPEEGSHTPLYLCFASDEELRDRSGCYFANKRAQFLPKIQVNGNAKGAEDLWKDTFLKCGLK